MVDSGVEREVDSFIFDLAAGPFHFDGSCEQPRAACLAMAGAAMVHTDEAGIVLKAMYCAIGDAFGQNSYAAEHFAAAFCTGQTAYENLANMARGYSDRSTVVQG